jgi:predicted nucleic acid-binding protein
VIDWLKGRPPAPELLEELSSRGDLVAVNAVSIAETFSGVVEGDIEPVGKVLARFAYWQIGFDAARLAGEYRYRYAREGRTLAVPDVLLAAHAISEDATLITSNVRDFPMPELKILRLR